jgi:hypothetical protein
MKHYSSCAVHNPPALPAQPCNCGGYDDKPRIRVKAPTISCFEDAEGWHTYYRAQNGRMIASLSLSAPKDPFKVSYGIKSWMKRNT